ncbi:MAG: hypothetical protein ABI645_13415 [Pseudomonadota bacterium]
MQLIRKLDLAERSEPGRSAWLSSASGLVRTADEFCVVADDELHLGRFVLDAGRPGQLLRLFPGDLPDARKRRKKLKPDLEVLMNLPACADFPHGALLALGSGSGVHRCRGALLELGTRGRVIGKPRSVDAAALFAGLSRSFKDLNLEGGWVANKRLHLLQRGNKGNSRNAVLQWDLQPMLRSLVRDATLPDADPVQVREFDLGDIQGVPLCFTDASPLAQGGWLFSAVAENTSNAHDDGPCLGSAIGRMDAQSRIRWVRTVSRQLKIEGIAQMDGAKLQAWLVTDADDPRVPANLLHWEG